MTAAQPAKATGTEILAMTRQGCRFIGTWGVCGKQRWAQTEFCIIHDDDMRLAALNGQQGLSVADTLIDFADWLDSQGVLVSNQPEPRAAELRAKLVADFLAVCR